MRDDQPRQGWSPARLLSCSSVTTRKMLSSIGVLVRQSGKKSTTRDSSLCHLAASRACCSSRHRHTLPACCTFIVLPPLSSPHLCRHFDWRQVPSRSFRCSTIMKRVAQSAHILGILGPNAHRSMAGSLRASKPACCLPGPRPSLVPPQPAGPSRGRARRLHAARATPHPCPSPHRRCAWSIAVRPGIARLPFRLDRRSWALRGWCSFVRATLFALRDAARRRRPGGGPARGGPLAAGRAPCRPRPAAPRRDAASRRDRACQACPRPVHGELEGSRVRKRGGWGGSWME